MTGRQLQRWLALGARAVGDRNAAVRGPDVLGKRLVRRQVTRALFRVLR